MGSTPPIPAALLRIAEREPPLGLKARLQELHRRATSAMTILGSGRHRVAYSDRSSPETVVKIPKAVRHFGDNTSEARQYAAGEHGPEGRRLARCDLVEVWSIPVILMERVSYPKPSESLPDWATRIDQREVGYTKDGILVAFDYGS